ncbi:hypothetical protein MPTK1_1g27160 [Marchantia polymorpha subsp. ruderalis]|uniref:Uncharacterized protein n=2 Tax=Marchantia polymorpha TaxID=3197 RepID=A0AAF6AUS3_MARPO|nr:hypothetical protein MARPO_0002s0162 [Marchantia polymorpha]BBN00194.1 hypothetical protein Mp_1g27160 [Marchantia polymorpha subsp. ruderalis]|eukprot:PTQ49690.1 hypothetical protein MARPO_0002s0162 [Marchantia polymorpha]
MGFRGTLFQDEEGGGGLHDSRCMRLEHDYVVSRAEHVCCNGLNHFFSAMMMMMRRAKIRRRFVIWVDVLRR